MVSLSAVSAMDKKVGQVADKLEQLTHRAVTVTIENHHDLWALRGLQYYNENGECVGISLLFEKPRLNNHTLQTVDAPKPQVAPTEVAAAAFTSTLMKTMESETGTKGMISYEIDAPTHINDPSLFLLLAWDVSLVSGNFFAIDVISMPHTFLKNRASAEKKAVCDYLLRDRKTQAGEDTPLLNIEPPNVRFTKRYVAPEVGTPIKDPSFTVAATMNTMSVGKMSVFLYPSHRHEDDVPYTIKTLDLMALTNVKYIMDRAHGGEVHHRDVVRNDSAGAGFMAALTDLAFGEKEKVPPFIDGFDVFERVNKLRNKLVEKTDCGVALGVVNHTAVRLHRLAILYELACFVSYILNISIQFPTSIKLLSQAWELVDAISHVDTGYSVHAPSHRIDPQKHKFGAASFATTLTHLQPLTGSASKGFIAYTLTSTKWHNLWPVTLLIAWDMIPSESTVPDGKRRVTSANRFAVHTVELRHPPQVLISTRRRRQVYRTLMKHYALPAQQLYSAHVGVAVTRSVSKNMLVKAKNCFSVYASMSNTPIATLKVDLCPLQPAKEAAVTPEVWAWLDDVEEDLVSDVAAGVVGESEEDERAIVRSWDMPEKKEDQRPKSTKHGRKPQRLPPTLTSETQNHENDHAIASLPQEGETATDKDQTEDDDNDAAGKVGPLPDVQYVALPGHRRGVGRRRGVGQRRGIGHGMGRAPWERCGDGCLHDEKEETTESEEREERWWEAGGPDG
ncbi:hypothetical protein BC938DRAFT_482654 [Jimgerdemannia flammicorona]|uniref:Uncharacterized protein n=1 Tax=Jimgerdemannia flammicorona TaxID=994334 RepID=A0A433QDG0_9FUNG|nr:hypothetical protein BC938DRAFT_482654 [Jimgerdemannia flammicorona]